MRPALTVLAAVLLAVLPTAIAPAAQAAQAAETLPLTEAVAQLPVAAEDRTGYDREQSFGGWIDTDRDGCNTRMEVLLAEAVEAPAVTGRCTLAGGRWYSWYDTWIDGPHGLDIDHLVPLAEA
ncbi:hypothetical protein QF034_000058 [Streptomyces africanus]|uniref:HNH endonuclease n=1 Tax=Streptomyces africanus TaxID=231024 RepID=A0ABU0QH73_9ACTN|nr:hypothetical protein [Streptomyces africanus]MDQ0745827.1 hypothetical protein [Streptomyces africanus]